MFPSGTGWTTSARNLQPIWRSSSGETFSVLESLNVWRAFVAHHRFQSVPDGRGAHPVPPCRMERRLFLANVTMPPGASRTQQRGGAAQVPSPAPVRYASPHPARIGGFAYSRASATATAQRASALEAPTSTAIPPQKLPEPQRRAISALIGPGGQATDQPRRKPVCEKGDKGWGGKRSGHGRACITARCDRVNWSGAPTEPVPRVKAIEYGEPPDKDHRRRREQDGGQPAVPSRPAPLRVAAARTDATDGAEPDQRTGRAHGGSQSFDCRPEADPTDIGARRGRGTRGENRRNVADRPRSLPPPQVHSVRSGSRKADLHRRPPPSCAGAVVAENTGSRSRRSTCGLVRPGDEGVLAHDGVRRAIAGPSTPTAIADPMRPFPHQSPALPTTSGAPWRDTCAARRSKTRTRRFRNSCGATIFEPS